VAWDEAWGSQPYSYWAASRVSQRNGQEKESQVEIETNLGYLCVHALHDSVAQAETRKQSRNHTENIEKLFSREEYSLGTIQSGGPRNVGE
jgi:hypothetical protein